MNDLDSYIVSSISCIKLATFVEGNPKAPFSKATTPRCREGATAFHGLLYFTLDHYLIMLSVKQGGIKYYFLVFGMARLGIESRSPGPLANTLLIRSMLAKVEKILCERYKLSLITSKIKLVSSTR